ncbi:MAG: zinc dependent phospholipase C family protein [Candidatus Izemoplasmatales bacterium]
MADFYLHNYIVEQVTKQSTFPFVKPLLYIGAQGPDPYYYVLDSKTQGIAHKIANRCHDELTHDLLTNLVQLVKENLTEETYTFLVGFLTHYILDVTLHPYVYYHVGEYDPKNKSTYAFRGLHLRFERSIDYEMIRLNEGVRPERFDFNQRYFPKYELPSSISSLMNEVVKRTYQEPLASGLYHKGVLTMKRVLKQYAYDPYGIKKCIFRIVDGMNNTKPLLLADVSMYHHTSKFDFLNQHHRVWYHPVSNHPHNDSVSQLLDQAVNHSKSMISDIQSYLFNHQEIDFEKLFPNLSFNTGVPCGMKMNAFNNYTKMKYGR